MLAFTLEEKKYIIYLLWRIAEADEIVDELEKTYIGSVIQRLGFDVELLKNLKAADFEKSIPESEKERMTILYFTLCFSFLAQMEMYANLKP